MRRTDRQITERSQIDSIIRRSRVCHLGLICEGRPYVVPMNLGYDGTAIYLHMAPEGKKVAALKENPQVCLEFDLPGELRSGEQACQWGMAYESVIGWGNIEFLSSRSDKRRGVELIMEHYTHNVKGWSFSDERIDQVLVARVYLMELTGKTSR